MHIGSRIREKVRESGMDVAEFAARIFCTRTHVYKIFAKRTIDVDLLKRISQAVGHDFFADISKELDIPER